MQQAMHEQGTPRNNGWGAAMWPAPTHVRQSGTTMHTTNLVGLLRNDGLQLLLRVANMSHFATI
jgi:hypothetical protein